MGQESMSPNPPDQLSLLVSKLKSLENPGAALTIALLIQQRDRLFVLEQKQGIKNPQKLEKWIGKTEERIGNLPPTERTELTGILETKKREWGLGEEATVAKRPDGKFERNRSEIQIVYSGEREKEFPRLFELLKDQKELRKLLTTLSNYRMKYHDDLSDNSPLPPLEYARQNNLIFPYNDFIQICPVTESFRRHILILKDKSGKEKYLEVKIPGELKFKRNISGKDFLLGREVLEMNGGKAGVVKPVAMLTAQGKFDLYGQSIEFNGKKPLRMGVFEYEDGKRLARIIGEDLTTDDIQMLNNGYIDKALKDNKLTYKDLAIRAILVGRQLLSIGYVGGNRARTDFHLENLRLLTDGTVKAVCDFNVFLKANPLLTLTNFGELKFGERLKKKQIKELFEPFKKIKDLDFETIYKEALELEHKKKESISPA